MPSAQVRVCAVHLTFPFLTGLHQVSLRSKSGARSVRHAMPRWAPTSLMSPSSSLNLVHFIPPLSLRLQQSHMYLNATGAIYLTVLACGVGTFVTKSFLFNIALDVVSRTSCSLPSSPLTYSPVDLACNRKSRTSQIIDSGCLT